MAPTRQKTKAAPAVRPRTGLAAPRAADTVVDGAATGKLRLRTLVGLRWIAIFGQTFAIILVDRFLQFDLPTLLCLAAIGASAALNSYLSIRNPAPRLVRDTEAVFYLAFDIVQLTVLLFLTGGIQNPFTILLIVPVTISAATLGQTSTLILLALSFVCVTIISVVHEPLPWHGHGAFQTLPTVYKVGLWTAIILGIGFTAAYLRRIASESSRLADAYTATQLVMAREQRLSDLGALAAAAAHELGTPLATIQLTAKEVLNDIPLKSPYREDMELINSQIARCREILSRLSENKEKGDAIYARQRLTALVEEVISPHRKPNKHLHAFFSGADTPPEIWRRPEIIHGLENLIENAMDFAAATTAIEIYWDEQLIEISITDDGPGFAPEIEERLGEPYVSSRPAAKPSALRRQANLTGPSEEGMGLGFFIAKTLLERTGGQLAFSNHTGHTLPNGEHLKFGASVSVTWPRASLEATQLREAEPETAPPVNPTGAETP